MPLLPKHYVYTNPRVFSTYVLFDKLNLRNYTIIKDAFQMQLPNTNTSDEPTIDTRLSNPRIEDNRLKFSLIDASSGEILEEEIYSIPIPTTGTDDMSNDLLLQILSSIEAQNKILIDMQRDTNDPQLIPIKNTEVDSFFSTIHRGVVMDTGEVMDMVEIRRETGLIQKYWINQDGVQLSSPPPSWKLHMASGTSDENPFSLTVLNATSSLGSPVQITPIKFLLPHNGGVNQIVVSITYTDVSEVNFDDCYFNQVAGPTVDVVEPAFNDTPPHFGVNIENFPSIGIYEFEVLLKNNLGDSFTTTILFDVQSPMY